MQQELFPIEKEQKRTHKGRFASEIQFLRDENSRLKLELEVERRKSPAWRMIRQTTILQKEQKVFLDSVIIKLKNTVNTLKYENTRFME